MIDISVAIELGQQRFLHGGIVLVPVGHVLAVIRAKDAGGDEGEDADGDKAGDHGGNGLKNKNLGSQRGLHRNN